MLRKLAICAAALGSSACVYVSVDDDGSDYTLTMRRDLDNSTRCVIEGLDEGGFGGVRHHAVTIEPDSVVEVRPQQQVQDGADLYWVRLTVLDPLRTRAAMYAIDGWDERVGEAVFATCNAEAS